MAESQHISGMAQRSDGEEIGVLLSPVFVRRILCLSRRFVTRNLLQLLKDNNLYDKRNRSVFHIYFLLVRLKRDECGFKFDRFSTVVE